MDADAITTLAGVVAAVAALVALRYARQTVRETRELRREDRLARLPERVAELGQLALDVGSYDLKYTIERERVAALLAPLDDPLPACYRLAAGDEFADPSSLAKERISEVTSAALRELAEVMRSEG